MRAPEFGASLALELQIARDALVREHLLRVLEGRLAVALVREFRGVVLRAALVGAPGASRRELFADRHLARGRGLVVGARFGLGALAVARLGREPLQVLDLQNLGDGLPPGWGPPDGIDLLVEVWERVSRLGIWARGDDRELERRAKRSA